MIEKGKWVQLIRLDIFKGDNQRLNGLGCYCPHLEPKAEFGGYFPRVEPVLAPWTSVSSGETLRVSY